jgi:predicted transporter
MVVALLVLLAGLIWIDVYEVPFGLRSLACDIRVTPWRGILASPKVIFGLPMLIAESLVWAWILICIWPMPALSKPTAADWLLVVIVFLLAAAFLIFQVAAFQPAPWHQCLNGMRGV